MASKWNFKHTFVIVAILVFLVVSVGEAFATPVLVHSSREDYFSGGTIVTGCSGEGCSSLNFVIGNPSGVSLWEVVEKVFRDSAANTTEFTYTVFNDTLTPPIASFNVKAPGFSGVMGAPLAWTPSIQGMFWHWETSVSLFEIPATTSLGCNVPNAPVNTCFNVLLAGVVPVGFNTTFVDTSPDGLTHTNVFCTPTDQTCWQVSAPKVAVPEPASLMLLGSGLAGLWLWGRLWRRRHA